MDTVIICDILYVAVLICADLHVEIKRSRTERNHNRSWDA